MRHAPVAERAETSASAAEAAPRREAPPVSPHAASSSESEAGRVEAARRRHPWISALLPPSEMPVYSQPVQRAAHGGWRDRPRRLVQKPTAWLLQLGVAVGVLTMLALHASGRWLRRVLAPAGAFVRNMFARATAPVRRAAGAVARLGRDVGLAGRRLRQAAPQGVGAVMAQLAAWPRAAWRRHRRLWNVTAQGVMLAVAVWMLVLVVQYWQDTTFALELVYAGRSIGYITDEAVFREALDMAEGRVLESTDMYTIVREPQLTLRPVHQSAVISETELCDELLRLSGNKITPMSGLYVDGRFEGALMTHQQMEDLLAEILSAYDTEADTTEKKAEFMQKVEIVDGLYPSSISGNYEALHARLTARDENGAPYLGVQIRCTEVYTESIPFTRETVRDNSKYIGYSAVRVAGQEGERRVTADVIYVNGEELYREILSEETVREPVTEIVAVGNYRVNSDAQAGAATGQFLWPLPSCHTVYSPFGSRGGRRHAGIDISGNGVFGKDILAADGGRVTQVNTSGWGGGYGLYVIVDHGNGYVTMYAHCNEILVQEGDLVTQGQLIARVGNTGNSSGPHLHFEIRVNGSAVDPVPYLM